jgi:hypothetical protein
VDAAYFRGALWNYNIVISKLNEEGKSCCFSGALQKSMECLIAGVEIVYL